MKAPSATASATPDADCFVTTRWTLVRDARGASPEARQALSELCSACYAPVVAFLRREGRTDDAARELAHEFFANLLAGESLSEVDRCRGRFRSYLLGAVKHFLANRRRDASREKRGAAAEHVAISEGTDTSPGIEIADAGAFPPDTAFDREWALALVERSLTALQTECEQTGRAELFSVLKPWLTPASVPNSQAAGAKLGLSEGALKVAIHRLRARFRELVRADIAQTLYDPAELEDEMQHLVQALAR